MIMSKNKLFLKSVSSSQRIRPTMRKETIHPTDYNHLNLPYSCEECSHFVEKNKSCTLGLNTFYHLAEIQKKTYHLSGQMALCRFQEID